MRALIIDDERLARLELLRLLQSHSEVEIAGEARDGAEALDLIHRLEPDLLFLDIQMPGMSGFDLLDKLEQDVPQVIFTTAFDQYAIRAFEVNALDYLLKPIHPERLAGALARIAPRQTVRPTQVFVRDGDRCWIVPLHDIALLESEGNYTRLHFRDVRPLIRRSLAALEKTLDPRDFFRANRQQIVNLQCVERTYVDVNGSLTMDLRNGHQVSLSRRQSERLRALMSL